MDALAMVPQQIEYLGNKVAYLEANREDSEYCDSDIGDEDFRAMEEEQQDLTGETGSVQPKGRGRRTTGGTSVLNRGTFVKKKA